MSNRGYTPEAFLSDAPPERYIGTECEYNLQYKIAANQSRDASKYISASVLAQMGIKKVFKMLGNGGGIYPDLDLIEYDAPEALGPREAAIADLAGILVVAGMVKGTRLPHDGLYRVTGSFMREMVNGHESASGVTSGYHENYLLPRSVSESSWVDRVVPAHLASRIWAWVPTLRGSVVLSQKASGIGGKPIERTISRRTNHGSKPMCIIPPISSDGDVIGAKRWARLEVRFADAGQSPLGRYMSHGAMSTVLRTLEHADKIDRRKLGMIELKNPVLAAQIFSTDWSLKRTAETVDGRSVTVLDVQEGLSELAHEVNSIIELPENERPIPRLWTTLIDRLRQSQPEEGDWNGLERLIDIAAKTNYLTSRLPNEQLRYDNDEAMGHNLAWDRVLPTGGAQLWWQAHPTNLFSQEEVQRRVTRAPDGRAAERANYLNSTRISGFESINWSVARANGKTRQFSL